MISEIENFFIAVQRDIIKSLQHPEQKGWKRCRGRARSGNWRLKPECPENASHNRMDIEKVNWG